MTPHPLSQDELDAIRKQLKLTTLSYHIFNKFPVSRLLDEVERLRAENNRLNTIVGGIDVENPDAVNTMIDAMKVQGAELASLRSMLGRAAGALEAANRAINWEYIGWQSAGGPNECRHGYAEGVKCQRCDIEIVLRVLSEIRGVSGEQTSYRA